jgi:CelD/BcsL family acetyltransferase involved in cellulose biosynthesis
VVTAAGAGRARDEGPALETTVLRSRAGFAAIREEWDVLASCFGRALLRHDWFLSCAEALHEERDLRVVTVRASGRLVAAAPLVLAHAGWVPRLQLLGASALHEPCGLLYDSDDALRTLADGLVALGRPIVLQRLDAGSPVPAALRRALGRMGISMVRATEPAAGVPIRETWAEYERGLSSHITSNLRRQRARAAKVGTVSTEVLSPGVADVDALLAIVVAVEGSGWKGRNGSALRCRADLLDFFARYTRRAAEAGRLRIALLRIGGRVAAVELAVEDFRRWWQLKIGYADELRQYYPGLQLTVDIVRRAFERGLESYEFLGSEAEWETRWNPEPRPFELCVAYPGTVRGGAALTEDACGVAFRKLRSVARLPTATRVERARVADERSARPSVGAQR